MVIKVGINGFGRIGRIGFRTCFQHPDIEVSAINDPAVNIEYICYLIKFDSTHGKLQAEVSYKNNEITINDTIIKVYHQKIPGSIPWTAAGVQYVIEASGMFSTLEKASGHLTNDGVKRVIVTAPSVDIPMLILGVNDDFISEDMKVLSCGSSTLYCLAPIMKVLVDRFGVEDGFVTSIHAMTPSLKPLDGLCLRGKHWREHRSITQNIIPATTGACKALGKIIPQVKDKLTGLAFRVPIANVSVLDITIRLTQDTTLETIVQEVNKASRSIMLNTIKTSNEENVSSDFIGDIHSCILDESASLQLKPNYFKLVCWYENEYSYACRVVDSILFSEKQITVSNLPNKTTFLRIKSPKKQNMLQQTDFCKKEAQPKPEREFMENINLNLTAKAFSLKKALENSMKPIELSLLKPIAPLPRPVDCTKAQERLQKVKKEFDKMVDMTEVLLKNSNSSKYTLGSSILKDDNKSCSNNSPELVTDTESSSTTPFKYDNHYTFNAQNNEKTLLTINMDVTGDSSASTKDCMNEEIIKNTFYDKESAYSVKEIKKLFDSKQVTEKTVKPALVTEKFLNTSATHCTDFQNFISMHINNHKHLNHTEISSHCINEEKINQLNKNTANIQKINDTFVESPNAAQIQSRVVDKKTESRLVDLSVSQGSDKLDMRDDNYSEIDKEFAENHPPASHITSLIIEDKKSEGAYKAQKSPESKRRKVIDSELHLQSIITTENKENQEIENMIQLPEPRSAVTKSETDEHVPVNRISKNIVSKTITALLDGLSKNFQLQSFPGKEKNNTNISKEDTLNYGININEFHDKKTNDLNAVVDYLKKLKTVEQSNETSTDHKLGSEKNYMKNLFGINFRNLSSKGDIDRLNDFDMTEKYTTCILLESSKKEETKVSLTNDVISQDFNEEKEENKNKIDIKCFEYSEYPDETEKKVEKCNVPQSKSEAIPRRVQFSDGDSNLNIMTKIKEQPPESNFAETSIATSYISQSRYKFEPPTSQYKLVKDKLESASSIETLSGELKKRNIKLVNNTKNQEAILRSAKVESYLNDVECYNAISRVSSSNRPKSSQGSSPLSAERRVFKADLYEKLDSASASDSEMSAHIDGRKSQVLNITDLTSSLDDLERLDKVCRIIEISDELSDRLFSNLDKGPDTRVTKTIKKWSFKDLCEKIKLDEFCDDVFGK